MTITLFAACDDATNSGAIEQSGLVNRELYLEVEVAEDWSYRTTATFKYDAWSGSDVYFSVPDVDDPASLEVALDGRRVRDGLIYVAPHPLYAGNVFRIRQEAGAHVPGEHTLRVTTPRLESDEPSFAHWGDWHPYLGDRAVSVPTTIEARVPASLRAVASGRRVGEHTENGLRTSQWRSRNPQGWVFLAVGEYVDTTFVQNGSAVQVWIAGDGADLDVLALVQEPFRVLSFLEDKLGSAGIDTVRLAFIPRSELTNFSVDGLLVGSRATAARINDSPQYIRGFLAHEIAHYWFGDLLQSHAGGAGWVAEGFAEYWRYRYEEAVGGEPLFWQYRNQVLLRAFGWTDMPVLSSEEPAPAVELYYQKGPYVLYMLERMIGRDGLDETMRLFVDRFRGRSVTPDDFFGIAGVVAGQDLAWFSEQWLDRPRGPVLSNPEVRLRENGARYTLEVTVTQEEPVYRLDLPIVIRTSDGVDHAFVRTVEHASETFSFDLDRPATSVTLDPDYEVLKWFPMERLPIDFATVWQDLRAGKTYHVQDADAEWTPVREWIADQFGTDGATTDAATADYLLLFGDSAEQARRRLAATLPDPTEGTLQSFLRRDPARPQQVVIGVEGTVSGDVPPIIPEAPLTFVMGRNAMLVGGHAAGMPALTTNIVVER